LGVTETSRDLAAFDQIFHPEFRWHIAVTEHGDANMKPLQSKLLRGMNLPWQKSVYDKAETLGIFSSIFAGTPQFSIELRSVIADGDRVALELVGNGRNQASGRTYDNLYCYVFECRGGKIRLFREYQDTLLLFDVWVADSTDLLPVSVPLTRSVQPGHDPVSAESAASPAE